MTLAGTARIAGRYRLVRRLGAGGMGEVYLGAQEGPEGFRKLVVLKRMLPTVSSERALVRQFLDEARLVAELSHRGIVQIFDLGEDAEGYFLAMEYIPGPSVAVLIDRLGELGRKLSPSLALEIAIQVAEALAYAYSATAPDGHALRIVHRDVSPHNILVSQTGDVKLIDFGVAKSEKQLHSTEAGTVKGKLAYMSPEQSLGGEVDTRSDLFALGIVLFEMLTGAHPFPAGDPLEILLSIRRDEPRLPSALNPALAPFDPVVAKMLAKRPEDRHADGFAVAEDLMRLRGQVPSTGERLGALVASLFGQEISEMQRAVATGQPLPERAPSGVLVSKSLLFGPTHISSEKRGDLPPPEGVASGEPAPAQAPAAPQAPIPLRLVAPQPEAPRRSHRALELALAGVVMALAFAGGVSVMLLRAGPEEVVPASQPAVAVAAAEPARAEPEPRQAQPPPPSTAPKAAEQQPAAGPAEPEKKPEAAAKATREARSDPGRGKKSSPVKDALAKVETDPPEVPEPPSPPAPPQPPPPSVTGRVRVESAQGSRAVELRGERGRVKLPLPEPWAVYVSFETAGGLALTVDPEPWAIVSVNGVSLGRSPQPLRDAASPKRIELRRPGVTPIEFTVSAQAR